ncbi:MAG: amidophosphoribosyltransferase [Henriciella sp.]|jgi:amidophosphoribosyltransferase|uniref:amidophosphoribosyltransferase n=1 Tax=Henriciella sp. TaxID=1968823 RepID=UPI000C10835F|nr:amidophosphoribosyltransferase [Henriciella sp.]MAN74190.1 amidophosphoribosyltransferase [Henriciella sp.]MBF35352.1 amidophosphoribosyltransferase [Hyphomonadaceae bacterium]PHR73298.1 MAG: amidophosphoribosyltransferase [Henriciella sp.]|tara:strand:+ start:833 stop:2272 length:1440 start_codon:yes stop_codon:yes gene_type:complete
MIWDHDDDKPREECGIVGVFNHPEASLLTALGLHALQHRGQEACGITTYDGEKFHNERHMGLVGENFGGDLTTRLPGSSAIGHNRYSTQGKPAVRNIQPIFADLANTGFALAHNGNLTNAVALRRELINQGAIFQSTMDTEVVLQLVARSARTLMRERFMEALQAVEGGYAFVGLTNKKLIGARDPIGLRPLVLGKIGKGWVLASETCALDIIGAEFVREIENGETVIITDEGVQSYRAFPERPESPCLFEYVYFARPDSIVQGRSVYQVRRRMGHQLARENPADVDVIVPVPDSGVPAALGFSEQSGVPFQLGIIRSHYVGRTFIEPTQLGRQKSISKKHSPNRSVLEGKKVLLVDDSIVRGNTSKKIVQMVRDAGAKEVHLRSASPPIVNPDFYGIDMPTKGELLASNNSLEQMRDFLNVETLGFLSVDGLYAAIGIKRDIDMPQFSDHCFTGCYPTRLVDQMQEEGGKDRQLSLLD